MSLETGAFIADLVETNPVGATDFVSQGDDHIRLLKVCIKGSLPNLGSAAMTCDAAELNKLDGLLTTKVELGYVKDVTSAIQTQLDAKASNAALAALSAVYQPLDADLTAIAALATTSYGRGFLTLADNAALATKIAAMAPTWTGKHIYTPSGGTGADAADFNGRVKILTDQFSSVPAAGQPGGFGMLQQGGGYGLIFGILSSGDGYIQEGRTDGTGTLYKLLLNPLGGDVEIGGSTGVVKVNDAGTLREAGYRSLFERTISSLAASLAQTDNGKMVSVASASGTLTLGALAADTLVTILNISNSITIAAGSGTLYWFNGSGALSTGNRTAAVGAVITVKRSGADWYIWGVGIS